VTFAEHFGERVCLHFSCGRRIALFLALTLLGLATISTGQEQPAPASKPTAAGKTLAAPIRITWVGDIVMEVAWRQPPVAPQSLFGGVRQRLLESDLVIGNLESPLTDSPEMTPFKDKAALDAGRDVVLRTSSPEAAQALYDGGIRFVGLANNHTVDYTERGLLDTMQKLRQTGILYAGAGENLAAAEAARIVTIKGQRIGILSFSDVVPKYSWALANKPGIATAKESERVVAAVRRARPKVDLLIMVFHWGVQFDRETSPRQFFLAQEAARRRVHRARSGGLFGGEFRFPHDEFADAAHGAV
jgi:poly-gamma-glutamate capsule biosynthesis protein CapA/YwtB (metallophosphatase superfamily)